MQKRLLAGIFSLAIVATSVGTAHADAILTFTSTTLSTATGGTVEFDGTLTNTGETDLYLNGDGVILNYADLTVDDSIFYVDAPLFLSAGGSYTGAFFDVTTDAVTLSGSYSGTYTIQGGTDSDSFDDIATEDFTVNVDSNVPDVPEPNSFLLIGTGMTILAVLRLRQIEILRE